MKHSCPKCHKPLIADLGKTTRCKACGHRFKVFSRKSLEKTYDLTPQQRKAVLYSFQQVGRYMAPDLSTWEKGFLRDRNPAKEIQTWHQIAQAYERFLFANQLQLDAEEAKRHITCLVKLAGGAMPSTLREQEMSRYYLGVAV